MFARRLDRRILLKAVLNEGSVFGGLKADHVFGVRKILKVHMVWMQTWLSELTSLRRLHSDLSLGTLPKGWR